MDCYLFVDRIGVSSFLPHKFQCNRPTSTFCTLPVSLFTIIESLDAIMSGY